MDGILVLRLDRFWRSLQNLLENFKSFITTTLQITAIVDDIFMGIYWVGISVLTGGTSIALIGALTSIVGYLASILLATTTPQSIANNANQLFTSEWQNYNPSRFRLVFTANIWDTGTPQFSVWGRLTPGGSIF